MTMTDSEHLAFIKRIMQICNKYDQYDAIWWVDGAKAIVKCNDLFAWACADGEEITPENIELLEPAFRDAAAAEPSGSHGPELFCCRSAKMRPQRPWYKYFKDNEALIALFDACGPEREG